MSGERAVVCPDFFRVVNVPAEDDDPQAWMDDIQRCLDTAVSYVARAFSTDLNVWVRVMGFETVCGKQGCKLVIHFRSELTRT